MVAVLGGKPEAMFDLGMQELGGMTSFVKKGQKVVVKPNIGWDRTPEYAANTHPMLVKRVVEHCFSAGAKEVYVFDHTCDNWVNCYKNSGIEKAAKDAGAKVVPAHNESYYQEVAIPSAKILKSAKVHELILEADVFINVPVLKNHESTMMTSAMKGMMGVVWDRGYWHRNDRPKPNYLRKRELSFWPVTDRREIGCGHLSVSFQYHCSSLEWKRHTATAKNSTA